MAEFSKINGILPAKVNGIVPAYVNGLAFPTGGGFTLLNSNSAGINASGTVTLDTTGADLIVIVISNFFTPAPSTPTDSKSNTYTQAVNSAGGGQCRIYYCAAPVNDSSLVVTFAGSNIAAAVLAFSGCDTADALEATNSSIGSSRPGSVASALDGSLYVAGLAHDESGSAPTIDSSFAVEENVPSSGGAWYGVSAAVFVGSGSLNPTWTGSIEAATIAVFNPA